MSTSTILESAAPDSLPRLRLQKSHLADGISLAELLVLGGLAANRDTARRLIAQAQVRIGDRVIDNAMERLRLGDGLSDGTLHLAAGRSAVLVQAV